MSGGEKRQSLRARAGPHFRTGGAREGNSTAFKKVVMEKFFDGLGGGVLGEGSYFVHQGC